MCCGVPFRMVIVDHKELCIRLWRVKIVRRIHFMATIWDIDYQSTQSAKSIFCIYSFVVVRRLLISLFPWLVVFFSLLVNAPQTHLGACKRGIKGRGMESHWLAFFFLSFLLFQDLPRTVFYIKSLQQYTRISINDRSVSQCVSKKMKIPRRGAALA